MQSCFAAVHPLKLIARGANYISLVACYWSKGWGWEWALRVMS